MHPCPNSSFLSAWLPPLDTGKVRRCQGSPSRRSPWAICSGKKATCFRSRSVLQRLGALSRNTSETQRPRKGSQIHPIWSNMQSMSSLFSPLLPFVPKPSRIIEKNFGAGRIDTCILSGHSERTSPKDQCYSASNINVLIFQSEDPKTQDLPSWT